MLSNRLLTDSRILGLRYGSEKVTKTNMIAIAYITFCKLIIAEFVRRTQHHKMKRRMTELAMLADRSRMAYISSTIGCANFDPDWPLLFKVHEI